MGVGVSKAWAVRLGLCAVMAYLGIQALSGRQGLISLMALKERDQALRTELSALKAQNAALEARVARLSAGPSGDAAFIAERARIVLGRDRGAPHLAGPVMMASLP